VSATVPSTAATLSALLRAELLSMLRNRRGVMWVLVFPPVAMIAGVALSHATSAPERLAIAASAVTIGTFAQGLFGHANAMAVARERGVLVRLRCTPAPAWTLLLSRAIAQVALGLLGGAVVLLLAGPLFGATPTLLGALLAVPAVVAGAAAALAVGQLIAALAPSAGEVNAAARLTFFALFLLGDLPLSAPHLAPALTSATELTPYYVAWRLTSDALTGVGWSPNDALRLALLLAASALIAWVGVRVFRWEPR